MDGQEQWTGHTGSANRNVQPITKVLMELRPEFVNVSRVECFFFTQNVYKITVQQERSLIQKKDKDPSDIDRALTLNDSGCSDTGRLRCVYSQTDRQSD